jgi:hypothetical protein
MPKGLLHVGQLHLVVPHLKNIKEIEGEIMKSNESMEFKDPHLYHQTISVEPKRGLQVADKRNVGRKGQILIQT